MKKHLHHDFWQPLVMTYIMTIGFVIATWLIQYCTGVYDGGWIFYSKTCDTWILFLFSKIAENLIPTTIVFGFTIISSMGRKVDSESSAYTTLIISLFLLGMVGCVFLVADKSAIFYSILLLIYVIAFIILLCLQKVVRNSATPFRFKAEKSDGKY